MKRAIFRAIFFTSLLVILITVVGSLALVSHMTEKSLETSLSRLASDLVTVLENKNAPAVLGKFGQVRVTLVAPNGRVLYDSTGLTRLDNHAARPEVLLAKKGGFACTNRSSDTLGQRTLYCARKLSDGRVIRVSRSYETIYSQIGQLTLLIIPLVLLMIFASRRIAARLSEKILAPVKDLDLENPLKNSSFVYDELTPLLSRIHRQNQQIKKTTEQIALQSSEFFTVTESMSEGFVLLAPDAQILTANTSASRLLGTASPLIGVSFEAIDRDVFLALHNGKISESEGFHKDIEKNGRTLRLHASAVRRRGSLTGFIVLLTDITQERLAEQMRQEFTANVSHELKTPLQSIAGSAELLENNLVKPQDVSNFARRIVREAHSMACLINDILYLSKLDEGSAVGVVSEIHLKELADDVFLTLKDKADKARITLIYEGQDCVFHGIRAHFLELVQNLTDNAVKYNKEGGSVRVSGHREGKKLVLIVADTGIGITPQDQMRVFERFWRADTSHSKTIPGTGLGLSIVKRITLLYKGNIRIRSRPGVGSTFTIEIPNCF